MATQYKLIMGFIMGSITGFFDSLNHLFDSPAETEYPQARPIPETTASPTQSSYRRHPNSTYPTSSTQPQRYSQYHQPGHFVEEPPRQRPPHRVMNFDSGFSTVSDRQQTVTYGSRVLRIVRNDPNIINDCGVCSVAVATATDYSEALNACLRSGFTSAGMQPTAIRDAIQLLGYSASIKTIRNKDWRQLPQLAIVGVKSGHLTHSVVFHRDANNQEFIFDNTKSRPVSPSGYLLRDSRIVVVNR